MENPSNGTIKSALEWGGAFISGVLGIRYYHQARVKSDTQEFKELKLRVAAIARRQAELDSIRTSLEDHEQRLDRVELRAESDHREITRRLSRMDEKLDRLLNAGGR